MGPSLELYKVDPWEVVYQDRYVYIFDGEGFRYPRGGAYLLLKEYMEPGSYRFELETDPQAVEGRIEIVTREGQEAGKFFFDASADYPMACLPTCRDEQHPARFEPITYTEYMTWFSNQYDHVRDRDARQPADPGVPNVGTDADTDLTG